MSRILLAGLAAAALALGLGGSTFAQDGKVSWDPTGRSFNSRAVQSTYMPKTWDQYVKLVRSGGGNSTADDDGPPPTDCPPKPKAECRKSWGLSTPVNPFE